MENITLRSVNPQNYFQGNPYKENYENKKWMNYKTIESAEDDELVIDLIYTKKSLPKELKEIYDVIENSKFIMDLKDNWDDEGSIGYKKNTWMRLSNFLIDNSKFIYEKFNNAIIPKPRITPAPEGSIDIYWKNSKGYLLVNVPENKEDKINYFSKLNESNSCIENNFEIENNNFNPKFLLCLISLV